MWNDLGRDLLSGRQTSRGTLTWRRKHSPGPGLGVVVCLVLTWILVGVNIAGVRESGIFSLATTILKLIPLVVIGSVGLLFVDADTLPPMNPGTGNPASVFASAFAITFWAFVGIEAATVPSEDVIEPEKTVSRAKNLPIGPCC